MTRILIVDDHPVIRRGLREIIAEELPAATIGEAGDYPTALQQLHNAPWELVLLDINLPGRNGLELLEETRRLQPRTRVLMVSAYPEEQFAVRALKLGAAGFLSKGQAPDELVAAIRRVLAGGKYVTASLAEHLADVLTGSVELVPHDLLSARELQVLRLVAEGKTSRAIAAELSLSEKTVATYRTRITRKTGLSGNAAFARYACEHGLLGAEHLARREHQ